MSFIVAGRLVDLPSDIRARLGGFRHKVFVQRLHWDIPGVSHDATSEWDEFDGGETVHLVALSTENEVCGCARLMPTTGPYLLRDVFPELAGQGDSPQSSPSIWEMSRFASSGLSDFRTGSTAGMSLFPYAIALARSFGATRVIGVVSRSVARLYRRFGLDLHDLGNGAAPGRTSIVACSIELDAATFDRLGCDPVTLLGGIAFFGQLVRPGGTPAQSHPVEAAAPSARAADTVPLAPFDGKTAHMRATV
ncbi:acyl-homoserine-lactone synthase [Burkholderia multivorans]|uniref:acyl-homoserine-lactone synthase n=1 Tax=Burkholderia multivorans TaxID=87883 RepID=UPI001C27E03C|nr:acyl-homoserine-lactone synthase [Burkholderia multivorans]MBU9597934.1 N-acyl homoserine lactone synthase [Burkholderia multivorans]MDN8000229.1 acyl-homoserine-lactone synthase [Burkholderia multivorans]WVN01619.1 acyl-homoserine-lactone synthase [Burkholderia multivorans]